MGFNASGAAAGAAAGASLGPWGALAGGVIGGFAGGGGSDGSGGTPAPVYVPPAQTIAGGSNPYGGFYVDPNTGAVTQYQYGSPYSANEYQNQLVMSALMGQPNSQAEMDYNSSIQQIKSQLDALSAQSAPDYGKMYNQYMSGPDGPVLGWAKFQQAWQAANKDYAANAPQIEAQKANLLQAMKGLQDAHNASQLSGGASSNPMLQFLNQGKYNNISDIINLNNNAAQLQAQQEMASRGLSGSSMADLNNRQNQLQRGVQLGSALQNVGQQDFNSRMAMLQMLQGQNAAQQQSRLANSQMSLGYNELATGVGQNYANAAMGVNATNAGIANASNWAKFNQNQQNASNLGAAAGAVNWGNMFGNGSGSSMGGGGSAPSSYSGGNLASNPAYNNGSNNPYNFNLNSGFSTHMTAAGG